MVLAGNWQFFCCGGKFSLRLEKKSFSRLSGGCVSFWFWREIGIFFVVARKFYYDQKKKVPVVCLAGCAVASVFGVICLAGTRSITTGKKRYRREIFITTGKKSSSRLSGGCVSFWFWREIGSFLLWREIFIKTGKKKVPVVSQFLVLAGNGQFFCCGEKFSLQPKKKSSSRLSGGCVGSGDYDRKKKFQSSVWRVVLLW